MPPDLIGVIASFSFVNMNAAVDAVRLEALEIVRE
jgi:hypothetical protein